MRIALFANNWVAWKIVEEVARSGHDIACLILHPVEHRRYGAEILEAAGLSPEYVLDAGDLSVRALAEAVSVVHPDLGLSVFYGYILPQQILDLFPGGVLNLHPSYLPHNRGAYPNVWSIVEGSPSGVTLHYVDAGVDTGDIVAQQTVPVEAVDTGESLYRRLEQACVDLFTEYWPRVLAGTVTRTPQGAGTGSYHRKADVLALDEIDLDRTYKAREFLDIIRARTFPPYPGAYFWDGDRKVSIRVELRYEGLSDE